MRMTNETTGTHSFGIGNRLAGVGRRIDPRHPTTREDTRRSTTVVVGRRSETIVDVIEGPPASERRPGGRCGAMHADVVVQPAGWGLWAAGTRDVPGHAGRVHSHVFLPVGLGRLRSRLRLLRGSLGLLLGGLLLADGMTAIRHRSILASGDSKEHVKATAAFGISVEDASAHCKRAFDQR